MICKLTVWLSSDQNWIQYLSFSQYVIFIILYHNCKTETQSYCSLIRSQLQSCSFSNSTTSTLSQTSMSSTHSILILQLFKRQSRFVLMSCVSEDVFVFMFILIASISSSLSFSLRLRWTLSEMHWWETTLTLSENTEIDSIVTWVSEIRLSLWDQCKSDSSFSSIQLVLVSLFARFS